MSIKIFVVTLKQAKQAIKCMFLNTTENKEKIFSDILDVIKENLNGDKGKNYLTAIVALGHLALYLPEKFPVQIKNLVSRKIVKELVMKADMETEFLGIFENNLQCYCYKGAELFM